MWLFSSSGLINQQNESRFYPNLTVQMKYYNIVFREFILIIDCEEIFHYHNIDGKNFASHFQKVVILQELQKMFELLYIGKNHKK